MSPRALVTISAALAACASRTPTERERALEQLPAQAHVIVAADGPALSSSAFRRVIDAARPHVPASLDCVIDAAMRGRAIAVAIHPDTGATIVLVTRAHVARCPALSKIADDLWAATIGAGTLAEDRTQSVLAGERWERARPYLLREPFALAIEHPTHRAIAVAQPEPVDAWVAIDSLDTSALARDVEATLARWKAEGATAGTLEVRRAGTQVAVHAEQLAADDLEQIVVDLLRASDLATAPRAPVFSCPPTGSGIVNCHDGTHVTVISVAALLRELAAVEAVPVIAGHTVIGIRLIGDPPRLLRRDDVILGLGAHRITSARQLADLADHHARRAVLAVRREGVDGVINLGE